MNKQIRLISALAFGMIILSISTLANAEVILNVPEATLVAKGAGVDVSLQVTCNPIFGDSQLSASGVLTQRTGNSITSASFYTPYPAATVNCNGSPQDFDIIAVVTSPGKPFKNGVAFINIAATVFNPLTFQSESGVFQQEIKIH